MNCPDIETIIRLAVKSPDISDAENAAHIFVCPDCRQHFLQAFNSCNRIYEPPPADVTEANRVVSEFFMKRNIMQEIIEFMKAKLENSPFLSLLTEKIPCLSGTAPLVFASSSKIKKQSLSPAPEIFFSADISPETQGYWQACIKLPMIVSKTTIFEITVTDRNDRPIPQATLYFRGTPLKVFRGRTKLPFDKFTANTHDKCLKLSYPDGNAISGSIELR